MALSSSVKRRKQGPSCVFEVVKKSEARKLKRKSERSRRNFMVSQLFITNLPYNCSEHELQDWIESRGIEIDSVRIIRDAVAGVSPAFGYAELNDRMRIEEAITALNGKHMRNQTVAVRRASRSHGAFVGGARVRGSDHGL